MRKDAGKRQSPKRPAGSDRERPGWHGRSRLLIALAMGVGMTHQQAKAEVKRVFRHEAG